MNHINHSCAKAAAAVLVAVAGFALAPTTIDPAAADASGSNGAASRSWVADTFPTGQATFRAIGRAWELSRWIPRPAASRSALVNR